MVDLAQFQAKQRVLASYNEASSVTSFAVKTPGHVPANMKLSRISYILPPWVPDDYRGEAGFVDFIFTGQAGYLIVSQGYLTPYDATLAPPNRKGQVRVNGNIATWIDGYLTVDTPAVGETPDMNPTAKWVSGTLSLGWNEGGLIGYRLVSSGLSLNELVKFAEALK